MLFTKRFQVIQAEQRQALLMFLTQSQPMGEVPSSSSDAGRGNKQLLGGLVVVGAFRYVWFVFEFNSENTWEDQWEGSVLHVQFRLHLKLEVQPTCLNQMQTYISLQCQSHYHASAIYAIASQPEAKFFPGPLLVISLPFPLMVVQQLFHWMAEIARRILLWSSSV